MTWTKDFLHFPRTVLDIVEIRKKQRVSYQLHLQSSEADYPRMGHLVHSLSTSEPLFSLALRALNKLECAQNEKATTLNSRHEIRLLDISISFSGEGVEPLVEIEGLRATLEHRSAICDFRNAKGESKKWPLLLSQKSKGPYTVAAMLFRKALSDRSYVNAAYSGPM
jgi:hypothetical protein